VIKVGDPLSAATDRVRRASMGGGIDTERASLYVGARLGMEFPLEAPLKADDSCDAPMKVPAPGDRIHG